MMKTKLSAWLMRCVGAVLGMCLLTAHAEVIDGLGSALISSNEWVWFRGDASDKRTNWPSGGSGDLTEVQVSGAGLAVDSGTGPIPVLRLTNAALSGITVSNVVLQFNTAGVLTNAITGTTPLYSYTETDPVFGGWSNNFHAKVVASITNNQPSVNMGSGFTFNGAVPLTNAVNAYGVGGGLVTNWIYAVSAGSNTTVAVETNAQTITYTIHAEEGSGAGITGRAFDFDGIMQYQAVSNRFGKSLAGYVVDNSSFILAPQCWQTYETNGLQRFNLFKHLLVDTNDVRYLRGSNAIIVHWLASQTNVSNEKVEFALYRGWLNGNAITNNVALVASNAAVNAAAVDTPQATAFSYVGDTNVYHFYTLKATVYLMSTNFGVTPTKFSIIGGSIHAIP